MPRPVWLVVGAALLVAGFLPFALKFYAGAAARSTNGDCLQLPIGSICGAAWDVEEGIALVALCDFARVQAYDSDGRFRFGWSVPASGGNFHLARLTEGHYEINMVRGRRSLILNAHGVEVLHREDTGPSTATADKLSSQSQPRLSVKTSAMGDKVSLEWPSRTVTVGGAWVAPLIASNFLGFALSILGVACLETWRRGR